MKFEGLSKFCFKFKDNRFTSLFLQIVSRILSNEIYKFWILRCFKDLDYATIWMTMSWSFSRLSSSKSLTKLTVSWLKFMQDYASRLRIDSSRGWHLLEKLDKVSESSPSCGMSWETTKSRNSLATIWEHVMFSIEMLFIWSNFRT